MKTLFFCIEVAGYLANGIQTFHQQTGSKVCVVYYPNSPQAPFSISLPGMELINRRDHDYASLSAKCFDFKPDLIYLAGWTDKDYKRICKQFKERGVRIINGVDNPWKGTLRQWIAAIFSSWLIKPYCTHVWVAGRRQFLFARRLGFSYDKIIPGLYAADLEKFDSIKESALAKYLVFVGRLEEVKGIQFLYEVFCDLTPEERNGWKLKIIGNGSQKPKLVPNEFIDIYEFMQPAELVTFVSDAGGFILPSFEEPWGVVVQEFAAAGKPLLLSSQVHSGEEFLIHQYNGYKFQSGNSAELKETLIRFFKLTLEERQKMGKRSKELAQRITPTYWSGQLASIIKND